METHLALVNLEQDKEGEDWAESPEAMGDGSSSPSLQPRPTYLETPRQFHPERDQGESNPESSFGLQVDTYYGASVPDFTALEFVEPYIERAGTISPQAVSEQPPVLLDLTELVHEPQSPVQPAPEAMEVNEGDNHFQVAPEQSPISEDEKHKDTENESSKEQDNDNEDDNGDVYQEGYRGSKFTKEEDEKLRQSVAIYGRNWALIANLLPGKNRKQVRERYENFLKKRISRSPFTPEEDALILQLIERMGRKFYAIAEQMEGRTAIMIKNRYYNKLKTVKHRSRAQSDDLI